jgi:23S rRNA (pseudouridine1915-N3)-methyltransferase
VKVTIAAIGKTKSGCAEMQLASSYLSRIPWQTEIKETEEKRPLPPIKLIEQEANLLLELAPNNGLRIILDETGKTMDSPDFAKWIGAQQEQGVSQFSFFIGGAHGHGQALRKQANMSLSLGSMTWPHLLVRTLLAEQLYRAYTILTNHPYHKSGF